MREVEIISEKLSDLSNSIDALMEDLERRDLDDLRFQFEEINNQINVINKKNNEASEIIDEALKRARENHERFSDIMNSDDGDEVDNFMNVIGDFEK